jgi:putative ABC transport system permease protein
LQREVVDKFPNVQIFDVDDIIQTVQRLINNFVLAISFVGSFVMLSGVLILMGSIALTKSQRIYETAVLKTLGADRRTLSGIMLAEYILLGLLAGTIGAAFATALSFVISRYLMNIEWTFQPLVTVLGIVITAVVVTAVGVLGSFDVLFRKPLSTLRSQ